MDSKVYHDEKKAVFGIFQTRAAVEICVDRLKAEGFNNTDISVLMPEKGGADKLSTENSTKAPEGATTGAGTGLVIGGALGWLVGIGSLAIPGVGPFIAAGPIMALLAGAAAGATLGGVAGGLVGMGIPEYEAKRYEGYVNAGGILLSVHTGNSDEISKAKLILEQTGATDISQSAEVTGTAKTAKTDVVRPRI